VCYAQPEKKKSQQVLEAFAAGCGGRMAWTTGKLEDGPAVFYGVRPAWSHLWEQAKADDRDWFYIDNAYFDVSRETSFRITRNSLQCDGLQGCWSGKGGARLKALGLTVAPWRATGDHIVVCPQSDEFTKVCGGYAGDWLAEVQAVLGVHTGRPIVVRRKGDTKPLSCDLKGAWALVTHMSCAAVTALMSGIPVFCTGRCSARWMGHGDLTMIEQPYMPEGREEWSAVLAQNQWTLNEMASGEAWRDLRGRDPQGLV